MKGIAQVGAALRTGWSGTRPVLRLGAVPITLVTGSLALARRAWAWAMVPTEMSERGYRLLGLVIAVGTAGRAAEIEPLLMTPLTLAWGTAALLLAPPPQKPAGRRRWPLRRPAKTEPTAAEEATVEAPAEPLWPLTGEAFTALLQEAIRDRRGVLLRDLTAPLREAGAPAGWGMPDTRALCTSHGVPVRASVKTPQGTSTGVHRDDLPAPGSTSPRPAAKGGPGASSSPTTTPVTCNN